MVLIILSLLVILLICILVIAWQHSYEGFSSLRKTRATLTPMVISTIHKGKQLYLNNYDNLVINTSIVQDHKLLFRIYKGRIKLIQNQNYLEWEPMHIGKHFYVLAQKKSRGDLKHKWSFIKKKSGFYLFQKIGKKRIYLYIDRNDVVTGSTKKKTIFKIEQKQLGE